jgi:sulfide:quinone oxidoreductase
MKKLVILGAGTAGTMMLNKLHHELDKEEWEITIIDQYKTHYYQPGFLFIPFGIYSKKDVVKPKYDFFPPGVNVIFSPIDKVIGDENKVLLEGGKVLKYDFLIIATGTETRPSETEGLQGKLWYKDIFDFYSVEGAVALHNRFIDW